MNTNPLLINEKVLAVLPGLAVCLGLNEAILIQQIHYWLNKSTQEFDGKKWVYNTYQGWQEQFPFWSVSTIRRIISNLEKMEVLETRTDLNKMKIDNTKWYTINYNKLLSVSRPSVQNEQTSCSKWAGVSVQSEQANNHRLPESTTYKKHTVENYSEKFETFWKQYPKKIKKGGALKAWKKLGVEKNGLYKKIMDSVNSNIPLIVAGGKIKFVPNPQTWLNAGGWDDEPPNTKNKPQKSTHELARERGLI